MKLFRAGEPVKMSKRAGTFVTLRDVVDEVGRDPVRFMMLYRKNDAPLDFDFAKVVEQSKDNPVFYVQYAHARARRCSAMRGGVPRADAGRAAVLGRPVAARRMRANSTSSRRWRLSRSSSMVPLERRSHTASPSTYMIWLQPCTPNGRRAMNRHICDLSRQMTGFSPQHASRLSWPTNGRRPQD